MSELIIFEELLGKTFKEVINDDDREICFISNEGDNYKFYHEQDCCESVYVDDICGDLTDLVGSPILEAESVTKQDFIDHESITWTFYKFATIKGSVNVTWKGTSNGQYSEEVDFKRF